MLINFFIIDSHLLQIPLPQELELKDEDEEDDAADDSRYSRYLDHSLVFRALRRCRLPDK